MPHHDEQDKRMQITVSMDDQGAVWARTCQGAPLAACFLKAVDETTTALEDMGYQSFAHHYPTASIAVGTGMEAEDLDDLFVEASEGCRDADCPAAPRAPAESSPASSAGSPSKYPRKTGHQRASRT